MAERAGLGPQGRIYQLTGGAADPGHPVEQYITMNTAYPEDGGGWLTRRYNQGDFASVSSPGACWYQGNIVYAIRQFDGNADSNDRLGVAFYATGVTKTLMGDFDDFAHIRDIGLSRSIRSISK